MTTFIIISIIAAFCCIALATLFESAVSFGDSCSTSRHIPMPANYRGWSNIHTINTERNCNITSIKKKTLRQALARMPIPLKVPIYKGFSMQQNKTSRALLTREAGFLLLAKLKSQSS